VELTAGERAELEAVISVGYDRSVASRAKMILDYAAGIGVSEIAASSGATRPTVYKWIARNRQSGIAGLDDRKSPGRPRVVTEEERARIIAVTKLPPPESTGLTHWSSHEMARYMKRCEGIDVSHNFVSELWRENDLKPRRNGTFKVSEDPGFSARAVDIVGIYLSPPAGAVVLSFDDKAQFHAPERTPAVLPTSFGKAEKRTRDYMRHGTTNLFAELEVLSGQVTPMYMPRKRAAELLRFVNGISRSYPKEQEIIVILDSTGTRNGEDVEAWLAGHPNFTFHCTPAGGSWISQIEGWFGIITRQAIERGSFKPLAELINRIDDFVKHWNQDAEPFEWTAATDGMLEKVAILNRDYKKLVADSQQ
jgi:transposase